ncbi:stalk domain-containing protein [Paenibacillus rigui]|uniref:Copper amine oxidase n=1 Tax=Paenibacillus rigui TaxID=554312 RepID=A0A229UVM4_9BACL|nr:stalk domain-containing protein [Paenibacillus rigui]OXM87647.1 hypothetical protein CF651_04015 [Paenibacillus rigui]
MRDFVTIKHLILLIVISLVLNNLTSLLVQAADHAESMLSEDFGEYINNMPIPNTQPSPWQEIGNQNEGTKVIVNGSENYGWVKSTNAGSDKAKPTYVKNKTLVFKNGAKYSLEGRIKVQTVGGGGLFFALSAFNGNDRITDIAPIRFASGNQVQNANGQKIADYMLGEWYNIALELDFTTGTQKKYTISLNGKQYGPYNFPSNVQIDTYTVKYLAITASRNTTTTAETEALIDYIRVAPKYNYAFPEPIASWDENVKAGQREAANKLMKDINNAISSGQKTFMIPAGNYRFNNSTKFYFKQLLDFTIEANGEVTFWNEAPASQAIYFDQCKNVTLKGITIDYDPLPTSQGDVIEINTVNKYIVVRIDDGFPILDDSWIQGTAGNNMRAIFYAADGSRQKGMMDWAKTIERVEGKTNEFRVRFVNNAIFNNNCNIVIGDKYIFAWNRGIVIYSTNSEKMTFEDITIYASPGFGVHELYGNGGNTYKRIKMIRRPGTKRFLVSNTDAFHSWMVKNGPLVEDSEFSHAGDDLSNVHGFFSMVYDQPAPDEIRVVTVNIVDFLKGSSVDFYDFESLKYLDRAEIIDMKQIEDPTLIENAKKFNTLARMQTGYDVTNLYRGSMYTLKLDKPVKVRTFDMLNSQDQMGKGAVFRNNYYHDGFANGVRVISTNAIVENNRIERTAHAGVLVSGKRYWMESAIPSNVLVKGNQISDTNILLSNRHYLIGGITVLNDTDILSKEKPSSNIDIIGNTITNPSLVGIYMSNARNSRIEGNRVIHPYSDPTPNNQGTVYGFHPAPSYGIYVTAATNITLFNNKVEGMPATMSGDIGIADYTDGIIYVSAYILNKIDNAVVMYNGSGDAYVNGTRTQIDGGSTDKSPVFAGGIAFVPAKFVSEKLGASVQWNGSNTSMSISYKDKNIVLNEGDTNMVVNGQTMDMGVVPLKAGTELLIPVEQLAEALGKSYVKDDKGLIMIGNTIDFTNESAVVDEIVKLYSYGGMRG